MMSFLNKSNTAIKGLITLVFHEFYNVPYTCCIRYVVLYHLA